MTIRKAFWMFTAVMMLCMASFGLTSCSDNDLTDPTVEQVKGTWWLQYDEQGKTFSNINYTRVIEILNFKEDGTGWWSRIFFDNDDNTPLDRYGGKSSDGSFTYTTAPDGTVILKLGEDWDKKYYPEQFTIKYLDGQLVVTRDDATINMDEASEQMAVWLEQLSTGGASADSYNINDADFTAENWRQQEAIYIYDGAGKIKDERGDDGYNLVNLPWYEGDRLTNLPEGFVEDITPENGWEWAFNRCGSRAIQNNNFFALYNKFTGILRFFFYLPYGFSTGNDHVWQVSMTDHLAQQIPWRYGIPMDKTITDKAAIGQSGTGTFMFYTTPWTNYMGDQGEIVPNAGWWAFDVDISLYRTETFAKTDNIRLQMRSWTTQHVTLNSTITAAIDGSIKQTINADVNMVQTQHLNNSTMGVIAKVGSIGGSLFSAVSNCMSGNTGDAVSAVIDMGKAGANLAGIKTEAAQDIDGSITGSLDGTINLGMTGNIDTEGTIRGSAPTVGIASPTFYLKDFYTKTSHVGQGVWNLKTSPVVIVSNIGRSLLRGDWGITLPRDNSGYEIWCEALYSFIDPSSIQVELNPKIFPEDKIEWMQVDAIRGLRGVMGWTGTDAHRQALGLSSRAILTKPGTKIISANAPHIENYLYASENKFGTQFAVQTPWQSTNIIYPDFGYTPVECVTGCGYKENNKITYIIEPQMFQSDWEWEESYTSHPLHVAGEEINVTLIIKLKDRKEPIVLNRMYLPEYSIQNLASAARSQALLKRLYLKKNLSSKTKGRTWWYDYQTDYIYRLIKEAKIVNESIIANEDWSITSASSSSANGLFNGTLSNYWNSKTSEKVNGVWFAEFKLPNGTITPKSYTFYNPSKLTAAKCPKSWKLMAKKKESDNWTVIATVNNDSKMYNAKASASITYPLDIENWAWTYFRLEVSANHGDSNEMQIGEMVFNY